MSKSHRLCDCQQVSVCDLTGIERFVVWAIRWRASAHGPDGFAVSCLQDSFAQAGLQSAQPAFEGFMQTLSRICSTCQAGRALQYLEILADSLQGIGGRIERWQAEGTVSHSPSFKPA